MKLHLVGGFLGSGKTTAIIHAAKLLMDEGLKVGVITNDQGKYLVDTAFFRLSSIPAVEVTGGCFCCNYDDLDSRLSQLVEASQPEVIFAESVGSCADIVATVVKPLIELGQPGVRPSSFSVFADARLLRRRLLGQDMPFNEDIVYIFDKQLEEAGLIVVNKIDLLTPAVREDVQRLLAKHYWGKPVIMQSSLTLPGVRSWVEMVQSGILDLPEAALQIDYDRYGAGEVRLAWLDETVHLEFPEGQGKQVLQDVITGLVSELARRGAGIGHLKFIIQREGTASKISIPALEEPDWEKFIPTISGASASLLVNARVEIPAEELRTLLRTVLQEQGQNYVITSEDAFHPVLPKPTHRML